MKLRRIALSAALSVLLLAASCGTVVAAAKSGAASPGQPTSSKSGSGSSLTGNGSVTGYASDGNLQIGTIVQLAKDDTSKVQPASQKNAQQMYGVTVDPALLSLTITDSSLKNEVFVATSGTYDVLVSTQDGVIKSGDYVTISSVDGVSMDAGTSGTTVFGRAVSGFDGKTNVLGSTQLKDPSGKVIRTVGIGIIPVAVNIQRNPDEKSTKAALPNALQRVGEAVAEKQVSTARIYLSVAITLMTVIITIAMLYSGIRSGLISIGRNPLSKKSIFRGLLEVVLTSLVILIIGLFAVYLLLKL